jgi:hypothetical protein
MVDELTDMELPPWMCGLVVALESTGRAIPLSRRAADGSSGAAADPLALSTCGRP